MNWDTFKDGLRIVTMGIIISIVTALLILGISWLPFNLR